MFWKFFGTLLLLRIAYLFSFFLWKMCRLYILPNFGFRRDLKKLGEWAVVTGATDGIGKAISKELAKRGLNIVLISRSEEKLDNAAKEIEQLNVKTKTIQFDYSNDSGYEVIKEKLKDMKIAVLVNNVGVSLDHPDYFLYFSEKFYENMININILSVLKMTKIVMKDMVERSSGIIVHVSSLSGVIPTPLLTVYSASKVFVNFFGQAIDSEYDDTGVKNQVITPFFVATKLSKFRPNGTTIPSAEAYAKQTVNALGLSSEMAGFWSHEIMIFVLSMCPKSYLLSSVFNSMCAFRKKWHKKQQSNAKQSKVD